MNALMNTRSCGSHGDGHQARTHAPVRGLLQRACACGGKTAGSGSCSDCERKRLQRKATSAGHADAVPAIVHEVLRAPGQPLAPGTRSYMEGRFGRSFADVRVHADARAAESAQAVEAAAYTVGRNIVFGSGRYAPEAADGRHLLAHELTHVVQQSRSAHAVQTSLTVGAPADAAEREAEQTADQVMDAHGSSIHVQQDAPAGRIRRKLKVDAAASDDKQTAIPQMTPLLQQLCPDFNVDAKSGAVTAKAGTGCAKGGFATVAGGAKKVGCCCLCTLARAPKDWSIVVSITAAPTTSRSGVVRMTPTSGATAPDLRYWSAGPTEKMVSLPPVEALGHELCGHAALMQAGAHPPDETQATSRTFSDIHDPTVKTENALAAEMSLGSAPRGLAGGGAHHGESLRVFTVQPFTPDSDALSATATAAVDATALFADGNPRQLIDVVGFRDAKDTKTGVSKTRADAVRAALDGRLKNKADVDFTPSKGAATVSIPRLQPAADGGVATAATVEVRLAREPTGLVNLPAGVSLPAKPAHVGPQTPAVVNSVVKAKGKGTGNACHDLLIKTAWT